jgi:hypothetical protein
MGQRTRTAEATLEVDIEAKAPVGALVTGDGRRRTFSGWIELAATIEDWRHDEENDAT